LENGGGVDRWVKKEKTKQGRKKISDQAVVVF
jgi:hypothetical protein